MSIEAMKQALEVLKADSMTDEQYGKTITDLEQAIVTEESSETQELVAWLITDEAINSIQVASIQRLIDRLKHAHHTDLCVRINGQDEWFQADWIKHLKRAHPQQAQPKEPLTDEWIRSKCNQTWVFDTVKQWVREVEAAHGIGKGEA